MFGNRKYDGLPLRQTEYVYKQRTEIISGKILTETTEKKKKESQLIVCQSTDNRLFSNP